MVRALCTNVNAAIDASLERHGVLPVRNGDGHRPLGPRVPGWDTPLIVAQSDAHAILQANRPAYNMVRPVDGRVECRAPQRSSDGWRACATSP